MTFSTTELYIAIILLGLTCFIFGILVGFAISYFKIERQTYSTEPEKKSIRKETDEPTNY